MDAQLLLLADSRLPAGGHAHSGGLEPAASAGVVTDVATLTAFLRGRLATSGLVGAALAAASATDGAGWARLDKEADARTPSPAQRKASRAQGRSLLRAAKATWPRARLDGLATIHEAGPHHPIVLGAATVAAGGGPSEAATIAAYGAVTGAAAAAVRLLGLDPLAVHRALAELAPEVDAVAAQALRTPDCASSAPLLDLLAERHLRADLRLFES